MTLVPKLRGLRYRRLSADITQETVAKYCGLTHSHYSKIERGLVQPKVLTLVKLAQLYDCTVDDLL